MTKNTRLIIVALTLVVYVAIVAFVFSALRHHDSAPVAPAVTVEQPIAAAPETPAEAPRAEKAPQRHAKHHRAHRAHIAPMPVPKPSVEPAAAPAPVVAPVVSKPAPRKHHRHREHPLPATLAPAPAAPEFHPGLFNGHI